MKITRVETVVSEAMPGLLLCRVHTDSGLVGSGETYYIPSAVEGVIHDWLCQRLLGADPFEIEGLWRFFYERAANFGARGAELRAISAIDLALWDIKGKALGVPVWELLGGRSQPSVRLYSSSGGPGYGGKRPPVDPNRVRGRWPGYGSIGEKMPLNDYWMAVHEPAAYARELVAEGLQAAKMWTLDPAAHALNGNVHISYKEIEKALQPFFIMRETVGYDLELILDGHGFFQLPVAERIAEVLSGIRPLWLEDVIRPDCIDTIADFRHRCRLPLAVSEMMIGAEDYRLVMEKRAADYIMIDPTWVGGISQTLKITDLAQCYNLPVAMHDCTGPLTLLAGVQVGIARGNVAWQESLRAFLRVNYPQMVTTLPAVENGRMLAPTVPGIGAGWRDELFASDRPVRISEE